MGWPTILASQFAKTQNFTTHHFKYLLAHSPCPRFERQTCGYPMYPSGFHRTLALKHDLTITGKLNKADTRQCGSATDAGKEHEKEFHDYWGSTLMP